MHRISNSHEFYKLNHNVTKLNKQLCLCQFFLGVGWWCCVAPTDYRNQLSLSATYIYFNIIKLSLPQKGKLKLKGIFGILYCFGIDFQVYLYKKLFPHIDEKTIIEWYYILRDVCCTPLLGEPVKLEDDINWYHWNWIFLEKKESTIADRATRNSWFLEWLNEVPKSGFTIGR